MADVLDNLGRYREQLQSLMRERFHLTPEVSTIVVGVLNLYAIIKRIHAEEEVLFQLPAYRSALADRARLIPGIY